MPGYEGPSVPPPSILQGQFRQTLPKAGSDASGKDFTAQKFGSKSAINAGHSACFHANLQVRRRSAADAAIRKAAGRRYQLTRAPALAPIPLVSSPKVTSSLANRAGRCRGANHRPFGDEQRTMRITVTACPTAKRHQTNGFLAAPRAKTIPATSGKPLAYRARRSEAAHSQ